MHYCILLFTDAPKLIGMKRTLVTGGAGFLGSHLCDRFVDEGHDVICMDNFLTGRAANVAHLIGNERFILLFSSELHYHLLKIN